LEEIIPGTLYLVATPIGNLADITFRAVHILKNVDLIAAEDTRKSRILCNHYEIRTQLSSYHSYNLKKETHKLIRQLQSGKSVALISDAGTPGISDPGYYLVNECIANLIAIVPLPGPTAFLTALVAPGLPNNRFVYEGFLPAKKGRNTRIKALGEEARTIIIYESPHRIKKTVDQLYENWGNRTCVLARELTKKFEEFKRTSLEELSTFLNEHPVKGELVLIVEGKQL
jgi:16S rRNA (cytidine1402-2'-O)-methyltransferase